VRTDFQIVVLSQDSDILYVMKRICDPTSYSFVQTFSTEETIPLMRSNTIDLVIVDLDLLGFSEAMSFLTSIKDKIGVSICISHNATKDEIHKLVHAGYINVLDKPLSVTDFSNCLTEVRKNTSKITDLS
jgi:DNA-binding NtrC family response regulator